MSVESPRWGLVGLGWVAYATYYLGRVNLSVAVPALESERGLGASEVGLLASAFFWVYALGGVATGRLADRFGSRLLVAGGLLGSAAANLVFGLSTTWTVLLIAWSLNGVFQAMGWSPLLGALPSWVPAESVERVAVILGSSFVAGSALGLAGAGLFVGSSGVVGVFVGPAVVMAAMAGIWLWAARGSVEESKRRGVPYLEGEPIGTAIVRTGRLWPIVAIVGLVYVATLVWIPMYLVDVHGMSPGGAGAVSAMLAGVGIVGSAGASRWFRGVGPRHRRLGLVLGAAALCFGSIPTVDRSLVAACVLLVACSVLVAAGASVVLGGFAVSGPRIGVATAGGMLALVFNVGGAVGSPVIGRLVDRAWWPAVFAVLAGALGIGMLLLLMMSVRGATPRAAVDW